MPRKRGVEEIPFDVADWGGRVVPPLYANDAERREQEEKPPDPAYAKLVEQAKRLEAERLG